MIRGRKKAVWWPGSRRFAETPVNVRHFKHLLLLRLYLPSPLRAAGGEAEGADWNGLILESREPLWLDSIPEHSKNEVRVERVFFLFDSCFFSERQDSWRQSGSELDC